MTVGTRSSLGVWRIALALAAVLFTSLLLNNQEYLFATELYENMDRAANLLLVREAERCPLLALSGTGHCSWPRAGGPAAKGANRGDTARGRFPAWFYVVLALTLLWGIRQRAN